MDRTAITGLVKTAQQVEQRTVVQQYGDWYTGRCWVGCYIWFSEEGPGRAAAPPSPLKFSSVPCVPLYCPTYEHLYSPEKAARQTEIQTIYYTVDKKHAHVQYKHACHNSDRLTLRLVLSCGLTRLSAIVVSLWLDREHGTVCLSNCDNQTAALNNLGGYLRHICLAKDYGA